MRVAIRDALYRTSRKPLQWGGLLGYQQLQVIAERLQELCTADPDNAYWRQLSRQVERTVDKNRASVLQLAEAHQWLLRIAACLRYPFFERSRPGAQWTAGSPRDGATPPRIPANSQTPDTAACPAQSIATALEQLWRATAAVL